MCTRAPRYRRVDDEGGGWPGTNEDVANAYVGGFIEVCNLGAFTAGTKLRMVVVGHSAGGTLALWTDHAIWSHPPGNAVPPPALIVGLAPVSDLVGGHEQRLSDDGDAIEQYMGGTPDTCPDDYAAASPLAHLPLRAPTIVAIGSDDENVPPAMVLA
jgi:acetyl esterase/lipase